MPDWAGAGKDCKMPFGGAHSVLPVTILRVLSLIETMQEIPHKASKGKCNGGRCGVAGGKIGVVPGWMACQQEG